MDLRTEQLSATDLPPRLQAASDGPPRLLCVEGVAAGAKHDLKDELTLGRGLHAGLVVQDRALSRLHARIESLGDGRWVLHDLGSKNGTFVNGRRVERHVLAFGDRIRIGGSVFLFTHANPWESEIARRERLELLGRLGAGVAHDFNNMLHVMGTTLEYLATALHARHVSDADIDACFRDMQSALTRATALTDRMLGMARGDGRGFARVNLSELCREVLELARRSAPSGVEIAGSVPGRLHVVGDREQLQQMLLNLCVNACDAMPRGGRLGFAVERIHAAAPSADSDGDRVRITISDTGIGMDDDTRRRIFEPFFTTKPPGEGTGLGLVSVAEAVRLHGGNVDLESAPGQGTTWRITLPHASFSSHATMDGLDSAKVVKVLKVDPLQVLLVDDEPALLRSLGGLLTARGHRVSTASDGHQALARCAEGRPDVVLMDLDMSRMGGHEALGALREKDPTLKVLLMSGEWRDGYASDLGLEPGGATGFLLKPCGLATLEAAISDLLQGRPPLVPRAVAR